MYSRLYIWVLRCPLFLLGNPFLNWRHHTDVASCEVISLLPLYQCRCKQRDIYIWFIQAFSFDEQDVQDTRGAQLLSWLLLYNQSAGSKLIVTLGLNHAALKQIWFLHIYNRSYQHCSHTYRALLYRMKQRPKGVPHHEQRTPRTRNTSAEHPKYSLQPLTKKKYDNFS